MSAAREYVERIFAIMRYRQSEGGVYLEVDSLTLSRGVPARSQMDDRADDSTILAADNGWHT